MSAVIIPKPRPVYPIIRKVVDGREFLHSPLTTLRVPRKTLHLNHRLGHVHLRCANCGGMSMKPVLEPTADGGWRVAELWCDDSRGGGCLAVKKLTPDGRLASGGKLSNQGASTP